MVQNFMGSQEPMESMPTEPLNTSKAAARDDNQNNHMVAVIIDSIFCLHTPIDYYPYILAMSNK